MKTILIKLAAITLLSVAVLGAACTFTRTPKTAQEALADGGQWGQKGGKGFC